MSRALSRAKPNSERALVLRHLLEQCGVKRRFCSGVSTRALRFRTRAVQPKAVSCASLRHCSPKVRKSSRALIYFLAVSKVAACSHDFSAF
jgi:hypothetical protein